MIHVRVAGEDGNKLVEILVFPFFIRIRKIWASFKKHQSMWVMTQEDIRGGSKKWLLVLLDSWSEWPIKQHPKWMVLAGTWGRCEALGVRIRCLGKQTLICGLLSLSKLGTLNLDLPNSHTDSIAVNICGVSGQKVLSISTLQTQAWQSPDALQLWVRARSWHLVIRTWNSPVRSKNSK